MADNKSQKSIVELQPFGWVASRQEDAAPPVQPSMPRAPEKKEDPEEPTGLENVVVDENETSPRPANWQKAVTDHFTPKPEDGQVEGKPKYGNMQDVIDMLEERRAAIHLPTKDELAKERRRRRTEGIISGITDGVTALSNLIFTTKYAPNMYDASSTMSGRWRDRWDKLKKEREADADRYLNYALTIGRLKDGQEQKEYQRGRDALQDQIRLSQEIRAQLKADRDAAMADLKMQLLAGKINEQEAAARAKEIEADFADQYWNARVDELKSRKSKNDRWQPSAGRGGTTLGSYVAYNPNNPSETKVIKAKNAKEAWTHVPNGWTMRQESTQRQSTKPDKWGDTQTTTTQTNPNPTNQGPGAALQGTIGW